MKPEGTEEEHAGRDELDREGNEPLSVTWFDMKTNSILHPMLAMNESKLKTGDHLH